MLQFLPVSLIEFKCNYIANVFNKKYQTELSKFYYTLFCGLIILWYSEMDATFWLN